MLSQTQVQEHPTPAYIGMWQGVVDDVVDRELRLRKPTVQNSFVRLDSGIVYVGPEHLRVLTAQKCKRCDRSGRPLYNNGRCEECNGH